MPPAWDTMSEKRSPGEKIMAITVMIPSVTAKYSAMRYVVSMESVDRQLLLYMLIFFAVVIVIIGFVLISGLYFVKSIVIPVREVIGRRQSALLPACTDCP